MVVQPWPKALAAASGKRPWPKSSLRPSGSLAGGGYQAPSQKRARTTGSGYEESASLEVHASDSEVDQDNGKQVTEEDQDQPEGINARPEDLEPGTAVFYWGGRRGVVQDAWAPLDRFWVKDESTGELVRDEHEEVIEFKCVDLMLNPVSNSTPAGHDLPPVAQEPVSESRCTVAGVMLIGVERQMQDILQHFGPPKANVRRSPQQLLAVACSHCTPHLLFGVASQGVAKEVWDLASSLRDDIHMSIRTSCLGQAVAQLGPDFLRLERHYCMSSVHVPYGWEEIKLSGNSSEQHQRQEVWNQIDLCITAEGEFPDDPSTTAAARRALSESCRVEVSDVLWGKQMQMLLRQRLGVDVPLQLDIDDARVTVLILPEDAIATKFRGILCLSEAPLSNQNPQDASITGINIQSEAAGASSPDKPERSLPSGERQVQGKTIAQWQKEQVQFAGEPKLPEGWLRIRSRTTGVIYYFNMYTAEATFKLPKIPLPEGWIERKSRSTGRTYYFNRVAGVSTFEQPDS